MADGDQNVKVVVRCRPLNEDEAAMNSAIAVAVDETRGDMHCWDFSHNFSPASTFDSSTTFKILKCQGVWWILFSGSITLTAKKKGQPEKGFTFDHVFGPNSKQLDIYNITARKIVDSVLEGYNGESWGVWGPRTPPRGWVWGSTHVFGLIPSSWISITARKIVGCSL